MSGWIALLALAVAMRFLMPAAMLFLEKSLRRLKAAWVKRGRRRRAESPGNDSISARIVSFLDDGTLLVEADGEQMLVSAGFREAEDEPTRYFAVGDEVVVEGPSLESAARALGRAASLREAPRMRVFVPSDDEVVHVAFAGDEDEYLGAAE